MTPTDKLPVLGANRSDRIASGLRALANMAPLIGGALAEIVTEIVPAQRIERIETYLIMLVEELTRVTGQQEQTAATVEKLLADKIREPANVDLIEDGARLASRALSKQRLAYISKCVASGLLDDERDRIRHKRILSIIEELDDEEILVLDAYGSRGSRKFDRFRPPPPVIGASASVRESNALFDAIIAKLKRLSLVTFKERTKVVELPQAVSGRGEKLRIPDIDAFGKPTGHRDITHLGRLVLESIGLEIEEPAGAASPKSPADRKS
jgi:hypothetical protein